MANKKNKVKYGLSKCHYALAHFDEDGNVTYDAPVPIPGAVSLSLDPSGEMEPWFADNEVYVVLSSNNGYEGTLEVALLPDSFRTDILHEELDSNGVLAENTDAEVEYFALLFEFDGDKHKTRHCLYRCSCSRPGIESSTTEDSAEPQTDELEITAMALPNGYVKVRTTADTDEDVYDSWFDKVYEPQAAAADSMSDEGASG